MRRLALLLVVLMLGSASATAGLSLGRVMWYIPEDWHPVHGKEELHNLSEAGEDSPCWVVGYGWKLLSTRRVRTRNDPWYSRGRLYQKWGWKLAVYNAGDEPFRFHAELDLVSTQDLVLSSVTYKSASTVRPLWVDPDEMATISGVGEYCVDSHKGEGRPASLSWRVWHN